MAHRLRLQENMENLARRKQLDHENHEAWLNKIHYYKHWEKQNSKYQNWTSDEYYLNSLRDYDQEKKKKEKEESINARREKLRQLLREEDLEYGLELTDSPREKSRQKTKEVCTDLLRDVNLGLKLAEDDRKRHEAELKLYNKWRNENPIIRDYQTNQNCASLKLAWLDQQIEKRMAQEKCEKETMMMIKNREELLKVEEEEQRKELEVKARKENELIQKINTQMDAYKNNERRNARLLEEIEECLQKRKEIDNLIQQRDSELKIRREKELAVFNINQSKLKLRKKAIEIEEQLQKEKQLIENLKKLQINEALENEEQKTNSKKAMENYLKHVRDQQNLEAQRQQYMSFIFDSEAKIMWQKQERLWKEEQQARDKLLQNVLKDLRSQIDEKIEQKLEHQKRIETEKEENLRVMEEANERMKEDQEELVKRKWERKKDLERQINEKEIRERENEMQEQKRRIEELDFIRKEEQRLRNELMQMQRSRYHPARYGRKNIFW